MILIVHLSPVWNQTKPCDVVVVVLAGIVFAFVALTFERERHENSLRMTFNARTAERTRLAWQLHDTPLQTLQGSNLIAEHAHEMVNSVAGGKTNLRAPERLVGENGRRRPSCPEDTLQICLAAARNACIHSQGPTVTVDLYFERVFGADIKDDGIGFDSATKPVKRAGHYGLAGVRERAAEIHVSLAIESSVQVGTLVRLTIPGKYVYGPSSPMVWIQSVRRSLWR